MESSKIFKRSHRSFDGESGNDFTHKKQKNYSAANVQPATANIKRKIRESYRKSNRYFDGASGNDFIPAKQKNYSSAYVKPEPTNIEETDKKLVELISYYEEILHSVESVSSKEEMEIIVTNTLRESEGYEVKLSSSKSCECIELLLSMTTDADLYSQFMKAFSQETFHICTDPKATHITELLLNFTLQYFKDWSKVLESEEDSAEKTNLLYFINWVSLLSEFVTENFVTLLSNRYSCHVIATLIRVLGGDTSESTDFSSKNSLSHKQEFRNQYIGEDMLESLRRKPIVLEEVPKYFSKILKTLRRSVLGLEQFDNYITDSASAAVIQTLICILKKRRSKCCQKIIGALSVKIFSEKNSDNVPHAFLHQSCSFIVEKMFEMADIDTQQSLWEVYFSDSVEYLIEHFAGNFIVQRLFDVVESKLLFSTMYEKVGPHFNKITNARYYGILVSIAGACNRLKIQQSQFMKDLMNCLDCAEPQDRQILLIPLVISLQVYGANMSATNQPRGPICLQGSLIAQAILNFQKPLKAVLSLLSMKSQQLAYLACHVQGCHVLNAFFKSSAVGEKNKEKLIHCLKPNLIDIACDRGGNLTLCRIWTAVSLKLRSVIAEELVNNYSTLKANKNGNCLLHKFKIFYFKRNNKMWIQSQNELSSSAKNVKKKA